MSVGFRSVCHSYFRSAILETIQASDHEMCRVYWNSCNFKNLEVPPSHSKQRMI
ncbi:hypothetical protein RchiOBHm_Chr7g0192521 [Rosa chinensis]|uniref:Uncharacterized protein n=1 Tax=Rosa chinensis TaxID=74649 RepID=A0A2P6P5L4_ROSCH|nr:hypothetical protein RchiOBHm_Chr7g0192521 [Rosa chinensis]